MKRFTLILLALCLLAPGAGVAKKKAAEAEAEEPEALLNSGLLAGITLRGIGPALTSGRVVDIAVHPEDDAVWYVATASGGVWKTTNRGIQWTPVFDSEGSYSIGCVTIDPNDPKIVWVGTGENNSQRSVSYGDGVYKSVDGGKSWQNVGLPDSEHIGRIVVDPRDSDVVYVAAQGPLWRAGGDRGVYKTTDGGTTWERVLEVDEHTGANEVWIDPRNPDVLYASTYQRRRRTWTLINGGPGSAIWKTTDGGAEWTKLENGIPSADKGKIGLAVSPVDPDVIYAVIESIGEEDGFFRSTDGGANWEKRSDHVSGSPQYYNELVPDPHDVDRVYSMDTFIRVTEDGGKSFSIVPWDHKHVDDHALWIDPEDPDHLVNGNDGGVYESWDRAAAWEYKANLPITQFYKVAIDEALPFYNIYGGTQDNNTLGGPSRTASQHGIMNRDWFVTVGGDGFEPAVDPTNPDVVYSQWQYGNLVRFDRKTGEVIDIQPQPEPGEDALRWNWDSPLIVSPHSPTRLYFAAQRVFRSDDRGDSWTPVSGDLSRGLDRNALEVMGKVWPLDTVAKNRSTSFFGNVVSLTESPLVEGLLYAGTDDGLVQVSEDGGANWRQVASFPGVPDRAYVADLVASSHDTDTVFAAIDNHKSGDFEPYLLRSTDRGVTWSSIASDLPERGTVYAVAEDPVKAELLFAGTEFGLYVSVDGGGGWVELSGGLPTVAVRDLEIQAREVDLVLATFGRGFYVLDDYTPLREISEEALGAEALMFSSRPAWMYHESFELGFPDKGFLGADLYNAPNPPFGAVLTYYLKDGLKTLEEERQEREKKAVEEGGTVGYPSWEELRAEDREDEPAVILTVRDTDGNVVRRMTGPKESGLHRVAWDFRFPASDPVEIGGGELSPWSSEPIGPMAAPGTYTAELSKWEDGAWTDLADPVSFEIRPLGLATLPAEDAAAVLAFQKRSAAAQRAATGASSAAEEIRSRIDHLRQATLDTPAGDLDWAVRLEGLETRLEEVLVELEGDRTVASRNEPVPPSLLNRLFQAIYGQWTSSSAPTKTHERQIEIVEEGLPGILEGLRSIEADLTTLEAEAEAAGAPWTPGRLPEWGG